MKRLCQFILVMIFTLVLVGCGDFNQNQNCEHTFESGVCLKCGLEEEIPYEYNKTKFDGKNMQIIIYCNTSDTDPFNPIYYKTDVESKKQRVLDIEEAYNIDIVFQEYPSDAKWGYERFEWIKANSLKTNTSNHIYSLNSNWVKALAEANAIAELYDESTSTGILKELKVGINEYMKEYSKDSKIYGYEVEHTHANAFMHYNINLIEEYGLEDPAALWNEGRWTYTQFFNYIENAQIEFNKNETTNTTIRPLRVRKTNTFHRTFNNDDDCHLSIWRGGRLFHIKLCRKNTICGSQFHHAFFDDSRRVRIHVRHRWQRPNRQNDGRGKI